MTDKERQIEDAVDKTLDRLNKIADIPTGSGFYARLHQKINRLEEKRVNRFAGFFVKIRLQPALIILLAAINLFSAAVIFLGHEKKETMRREYLESIADEYAPGIGGGYSGYYSNQ